MRQAARHFVRYDADYYLILAGDHLYRMDYCELVDAHIDRHGPTSPSPPSRWRSADASAMGIFRFDRAGQIVGLRREADRRPAGGDRPEHSAGATFGGHSSEKPFVASMGVYVFSRDVLFDVLQRGDATDFGREIIPSALADYRVTSYLHRGYWADVGTVASFYDANIMLTEPAAPFGFYDPRRPIYTHPRFLPGARFGGCSVRDSIVAEGCLMDEAQIDRSIIGIRTSVQSGTSIRRSVLLGADFYETDDEAPARSSAPRLGIGRDVVLDRVIVDKNARIGDGVRLVNEAGLGHADGDGYCIRQGIIIVPKDAIVRAGNLGLAPYS